MFVLQSADFQRLLRRVRDSNPRRLAPQRFSRPPQSTTLPTLQTRQIQYAKPFLIPMRNTLSPIPNLQRGRKDSAKPTQNQTPLLLDSRIHPPIPLAPPNMKPIQKQYRGTQHARVAQKLPTNSRTKTLPPPMPKTEPEFPPHLGCRLQFHTDYRQTQWNRPLHKNHR